MIRTVEMLYFVFEQDACAAGTAEIADDANPVSRGVAGVTDMSG